eukprot:30087-Pelagococcus_subviridis.AAC.33
MTRSRVAAVDPARVRAGSRRDIVSLTFNAVSAHSTRISRPTRSSEGPSKDINTSWYVRLRSSASEREVASFRDSLIASGKGNICYA